MAYFNQGYRLSVKPSKQAPHSFVQTAQVVTALDEGGTGGWDVYDVRLDDGTESSVYGFQITRVAKPRAKKNPSRTRSAELAHQLFGGPKRKVTKRFLKNESVGWNGFAVKIVKYGKDQTCIRGTGVSERCVPTSQIEDIPNWEWQNRWDQQWNGKKANPHKNPAATAYFVLMGDGMLYGPMSKNNAERQRAYQARMHKKGVSSPASGKLMQVISRDQLLSMAQNTPGDLGAAYAEVAARHLKGSARGGR
jgi:hypothetical protein